MVTAHGLSNRGTSLMPADLSPDSYKWYWASWTIVWQGDNEAGRLAIKQFDRARYTVIPELDIYVITSYSIHYTKLYEPIRNSILFRHVALQMRSTNLYGTTTQPFAAVGVTIFSGACRDCAIGK